MHNLVLVLLLPTYKIWQLQMSMVRKVTITGIFLLGGLVSIVGIIRIHFFTQAYASMETQPTFTDRTCKPSHKRIPDAYGGFQNANLNFRDLFRDFLLAYHRGPRWCAQRMPPDSPSCPGAPYEQFFLHSPPRLGRKTPPIMYSNTRSQQSPPRLHGRTPELEG